MNVNEYLEEVRSRTNGLLWALLFVDVALSLIWTTTDGHVWVFVLAVAIESSMTTIFILRENWGRAALFALFALNTMSHLVR